MKKLAALVLIIISLFYFTTEAQSAFNRGGWGRKFPKEAQSAFNWGGWKLKIGKGSPQSLPLVAPSIWLTSLNLLK
jgi:hypothetical protein